MAWQHSGRSLDGALGPSDYLGLGIALELDLAAGAEGAGPCGGKLPAEGHLTKLHAPDE